MIDVSNWKKFVEPVLSAMWEIGMPAPKKEIYERVKANTEFSDDLKVKVHNYKHGGAVPEIDYNIDWALTKLKKMYGLVENVQRGIWGIKERSEYNDITDILKKISIKDSGNNFVQDEEINDDELLADESLETISEKNWEDEQKNNIEEQLLNKVLKMNEYDFEDFCSLIFNAIGCTDVVVTKKSGDHGIDGYGKYSVNRIMALKFAFQCKRYAKNIPISEPMMNEFIAACSKFKRGIYITTSYFTQPAIDVVKNTYSDCIIDLIDGDKLKAILFDLGIGYKKTYVLDESLFNKFKYEE